VPVVRFACTPTERDVAQAHHRALPDLVVQTGRVQLFARDRVGTPQRVQPLAVLPRDRMPGPVPEMLARNDFPRQTNSRPTARTLGLESSRRVSTVCTSGHRARPPTLWWALMLRFHCPPPDSTRFRVTNNVPCPEHQPGFVCPTIRTAPRNARNDLRSDVLALALVRSPLPSPRLRCFGLLR